MNAGKEEEHGGDALLGLGGRGGLGSEHGGTCGIETLTRVRPPGSSRRIRSSTSSTLSSK